MTKVQVLKRVIVWSIGLVALLTLIAYVFLATQGQKVLSRYLNSLTDRKVVIEDISPLLPSGVEVTGFSIEGLIQVDKAYVFFDLPALSMGKIRNVTAVLEHPVLFLQRGKDSVLLPSEERPSEGSPQEPLEDPAVKPLSEKDVVIVESLVIYDGQIRISDEQLEREWILDKLQGELKNIPLVKTSVRTEAFLTASLEKLDVPFMGHLVKVNGWLNWAEKDMDVLVQALDDDGRIGLDLTLISKANDMNVAGKVRMSGRQQAQALGHKMGVIEHLVLGVLDAIDTDIQAGFSFKTAMDRFEMKKVSLSGEVTTGLNSSVSSGNIVDNLKAVGEVLLKEAAPAVEAK